MASWDKLDAELADKIEAELRRRPRTPRQHDEALALLERVRSLRHCAYCGGPSVGRACRACRSAALNDPHFIAEVTKATGAARLSVVENAGSPVRREV